MCVNGFDRYFDSEYTTTDGSLSPEIDPVKVLWTTLRKGAPLCALFNALRPKEPLEVKTEFRDLSNTNSCKASVYHFILACKKELQFKEDQLFTITELYQDDTNGFVKVVFGKVKGFLG
jgi:cell division control protein 24